MNSDLRSLEVSYFIQATEDEGKVAQGVRNIVGSGTDAERQELEGHFGNKIVWVKFHLVGDDASEAFSRLMSLMGEDEKRVLLNGIESSLDEHMALFIRLNKQLLTGGVAAVSSSDPVRVKVKPRRPPKDDPSGFYGRLMEPTRG